MAQILVQKPAAQDPVTLDILKDHLRLTGTDDDNLLRIYLQSAVELMETETGRSFANKDYRQLHDRFPRIHASSGSASSGYFYSAPRYASHRGDQRQTLKLLRSPVVKVAKITYTGLDQLDYNLYPVPADWLADSIYRLGNQVKDSNGNLQEATAVASSQPDGSGLSGSSTPAWDATEGNDTTDQDITWTNKGAAPAGDFLADLDGEPPRLHPLYLDTWPSALGTPNSVRVYFTAGYGDDGSGCPGSCKVGILKLAAHWYMNREIVTPDMLRIIPYGFENAVWSQRVMDYDPTP